jgi:glycosyltransferase involved in cell wall biosynthesis
LSELISVIVTTYDREDALAAVLRALARQTDRNFEVMVADDGSGCATRELIKRWSSQLKQLGHVWQEHRGFRAAEIRNRAIATAKGDLCIFLDGDCIPRPDFVAVHRRLAEPGWFVAGNRVLLSRPLTERVLRDRLEPELWPLSQWMQLRLRGEVNRIQPLLSLPLGAIRHWGGLAWQSIRSANLAVHRKDLLQVDGFDAAFSGWGREDSDLVLRLMHSGVRRKDGRFGTGVLHLWHPPDDRSRLPVNDKLLACAMDSRRTRAEIGLSALQRNGAEPGSPSILKPTRA